MANNGDNHTNALLEEIRSHMQAVLEISTDTRAKVTALPTMQEDIIELKDNVKVIKQAVTDTNKLLERRVTRLEGKIA